MSLKAYNQTSTCDHFRVSSTKLSHIKSYKTGQNTWNNCFQTVDNRQCRTVVTEQRGAAWWAPQSPSLPIWRQLLEYSIGRGSPNRAGDGDESWSCWAGWNVWGRQQTGGSSAEEELHLCLGNPTLWPNTKLHKSQEKVHEARELRAEGLPGQEVSQSARGWNSNTTDIQQRPQEISASAGRPKWPRGKGCLLSVLTDWNKPQRIKLATSQQPARTKCTTF